MAQTAVGIDIGDDLLSAAVVSGAGREAQVTDCACVLRAAGGLDLADELAALLAKLKERPSRCAAGISLSSVSLRNLPLPFTDEKKIKQILPFELEEQLLRPVEEQIVATASAAGDVGLLAAAADKGLLRTQLAAFQASGLEPYRVCPAVHVLADRLCRTNHTGDTFLLLHADLSSMQTALARQGEIVFLRRIVWPDSVFLHPVFRYDEQGAVRVEAPDEAAAAVSSLCGQLRRSVDYFCFQSGVSIQPDYFVLSGPMQNCPGFQEQMEAGFGLPGRTADLVRDGAVALAADCAAVWRPGLHDAALALALQASRKEAGLNFRQGELAPPRRLLGSKKQATAAAAVAAGLFCAACAGLFISKQRLKQRHGELTVQMEQVFKESFPSGKPGLDPLLQMQSQRKAMNTAGAVMPIFAEEQRILAILADISARIPASLDLHTARMTVDQEAVMLKGSTDAFNNVNAIQAALSRSGRYAEAAIVSAAKGKDGEGIQFEIRLKLAAAAGEGS
jgi:general secretion pathway protein L